MTDRCETTIVQRSRDVLIAFYNYVACISLFYGYSDTEKEVKKCEANCRLKQTYTVLVVCVDVTLPSLVVILRCIVVTVYA